jgi:hypothetical protein
LILIICGEFVVKRFSSAASSEAGPWQPQNWWCKCVATGVKRWLITNNTGRYQQRTEELKPRRDKCP